MTDPRAPAIAEEKILKLITALCFYADARQYAIDAEGYCPILGDGGNTAADALRDFDEDAKE